MNSVGSNEINLNFYSNGKKLGKARKVVKFWCVIHIVHS